MPIVEDYVSGDFVGDNTEAVDLGDPIQPRRDSFYLERIEQDVVESKAPSGDDPFPVQEQGQIQVDVVTELSQLQPPVNEAGHLGVKGLLSHLQENPGDHAIGESLLGQLKFALDHAISDVLQNGQFLQEASRLSSAANNLRFSQNVRDFEAAQDAILSSTETRSIWERFVAGVEAGDADEVLAAEEALIADNQQVALAAREARSNLSAIRGESILVACSSDAASGNVMPSVVSAVASVRELVSRDVMPIQAQLQFVVHEESQPISYLDGQIMVSESHPPQSDIERAISHHVGYHIERTNPALQVLFRKYLQHRTLGHQFNRISSYFPDRGFADTVISPAEGLNAARVSGDDRDNSVLGSYALRKFPQGGTALLATGIELMLHDPIRFASNDPEFFTLVQMSLSGQIFTIGEDQ